MIKYFSVATAFLFYRSTVMENIQILYRGPFMLNVTCPPLPPSFQQFFETEG